MAPSKKQKTALVTGYAIRCVQHFTAQNNHAIFIDTVISHRCGQGGIGEALVLEYKRRGVNPIATVLPNESSDHLTKAGITFFVLDVTKDESVVELKAKVQSLTGGRLDILVNCAYVSHLGKRNPLARSKCLGMAV